MGRVARSCGCCLTAVLGPVDVRERRGSSRHALHSELLQQSAQRVRKREVVAACPVAHDGLIDALSVHQHQAQVENGRSVDQCPLRSARLAAAVRNHVGAELRHHPGFGAATVNNSKLMGAGMRTYFIHAPVYLHRIVNCKHFRKLNRACACVYSLSLSWDCGCYSVVTGEGSMGTIVARLAMSCFTGRKFAPKLFSRGRSKRKAATD